MIEFGVRDVWEAAQRARHDTDVVYVSLHATLPATEENEVASHGYARVRVGDTAEAWPTVTFTSPPYAVCRSGAAPSPDAMRLDASRAEADAELAEWRALLDGAKGRRRG